MKKHTLIALFLLIALPSTAHVHAQNNRTWDSKEFILPYKHEISVSWGMDPTSVSINSYPYFSNHYGGLNNIYNSYMGKCTTAGVISVDYSYNVRKWFAAGAQINGSVTKYSEMSALEQGPSHQYRNYSLAALATAKFTFVRREYFRMYSSVGLGLRYAGAGEQKDLYSYQEKGVNVSAFIVPMGITAGKRIYGMCEIIMGTECYGARFGIGYRF